MGKRKNTKRRTRIGCMPGCERITLKERCDKHGQAESDRAAPAHAQGPAAEARRRGT